MDHSSGNVLRRPQNLEWSCNTGTWNWGDFVSAHMCEYSIIKGLIFHGYTGIDNRTKVLYLCNGIKSSALAPVQAMILADTELHPDFTRCVTMFADYV